MDLYTVAIYYPTVQIRFRILFSSIVLLFAFGLAPAAHAKPDLRACRVILQNLGSETPQELAARLWKAVEIPADEGVGPYLKYFLAAIVGMDGNTLQKVEVFRELVPKLNKQHLLATSEKWHAIEFHGADGSVIFRGGEPMIVFAPTGEIFRGNFPLDLFPSRRPSPDWVPDYTTLHNLESLGN